ncbi:MAG: DNA mismatch repair protein MutS [Cyclobacteriaceae bacterium]|nr:DNA mismatch repair protein MutS [Cyclobacteriaceae bacterium]
MDKGYFDKNSNKNQKEDERLSVVYNRISILRIASFLLALMAVIYFADIRNGSAVFITIFLFLINFVLLIKWHNRIKYARNHVRFLKQINQDEISRLKGDLSSFDTGEEFKSIPHYYSGDLDIFGRNSLFQLLNRTTTITGKNMLAHWLCHPAEKEEIEERQEAIHELAQQPDYCQNIQATGLHFQDMKACFEPLKKWVDEPLQLLTNKWYVVASYLLPIITMTLLVGFIWFNISVGFFLLTVLANGLLLKKVLPYSLKITEQTSKGVSTLNAISALVKEVEHTSFTSSLLCSIKNDLSKEGKCVSKRIIQLANILDFLNSRANMFYMGFNLLFLIDIHLIMRAEKWKSDNREEVENWFNRLSEFDVLASISRFSHANPAYAMPNITEDNYQFEGEAMAHPLIKVNDRVHNTFEAAEKGKVVIITGSNMSGKSTFLRTIGVNIVLGLLGAPVCATKMKISRCQVFTSMRTQDNLEEHISSFYAELKRIKQLLDLLEKEELPVLFMLDEILKGTNSLDRHKGAMALVKQLHKTNAFGFVSTHDLELGSEAKQLNYCENYSFNSQVVEDKINFDYKISNGICKSFNASALMKSIGIEVE